MILQCSLALGMAVLLPWNSIPALPAVLGVVVGADRAHLNSGVVSEGATVYDGDHFSTEAGGMLRVRCDATTLDLDEESDVIVRSRANGAQSMEAELSRGTLVFRVAQAAALEIAAKQALIRSAGDAGTIGQVSIIGPKELRIYARRGSMQFSYKGEARTIAEGESYRVILDPPEDGPKQKEAVKPGRKRKAFLLLGISAGAGGAAAMILENQRHKQVESPDRP